MKKKMKLMLLVVAMAVIVGASMNPVSAATLTLDETVEISYNKSEFNISVYPGNASYSGTNMAGDAVTGVFGDGTVSAYDFINQDPVTFAVSSYANDGSGTIAHAVATVDVDTKPSESWANVWTASDPGVDPADYAFGVDGTVLRGMNITGTIDISDMSSGTAYVLFGGIKQLVTLTATMSGAGVDDKVAEYTIDLLTTNPAGKNHIWASSFVFSDAEGYDTITYHYTHDGESKRGRFMGAIIDGTALITEPISIPVPNGDFETMYKPGTMITGNMEDNGYASGVGPDRPIGRGTFEFSDGTTGDFADITGWLGYSVGLADPNTANRGAPNAEDNYTVGGKHCFAANGVKWGNSPDGALITSDASLGLVEDGTYTLSMMINTWKNDGPPHATPVVLELLADGVSLVPTSVVDSPIDGINWVEISRTYDAATMAGVIGQDLTIVLGVGRDAVGTQTRFDDVLLAFVPRAIPIPVPNGDFEAIYKPGSTEITVTELGTWIDGVGANAPLNNNGVATFSDGTTGNFVDVPGWIGAPGWLGDNQWDGTDPNRQGAFNTGSGDDSIYSLGANGGNWGAPNGEMVVSAASLAEIEAGLSYTLSVRMRTANATNPPLPLVWDLLADGSALAPTSWVELAMTTEFQSFSKTYDAASLSDHLGKSLTIQLGVDSPSSGTQMKYDNVSLAYVPEEPEPSPGYYQLFDFDDQTVGAPPSIAGFDTTATVVSDAQAYSGNNSWNIEDTSGGTATLDFGWNDDMDFLTEGTWSMSLMMLVPTGTTGGFSLFWQGGGFLVADADADTVHLVAGGTWTAGDTTPLVRDQWVVYEMVFDGQTGVTTHYYDGIELGSDTSSEAGFGRFGGWVDPAIAGGWYIDDIALLQLQ